MLNLRSKPLRVAVLSSHRAPGIAWLLDQPSRGRLFEVVGCITSEEEFADREALSSHGVASFTHPIRRFHRERGLPLRNLESRIEYDTEMAGVLRSLEPDLIVLSSYLYILTSPILRLFENRIINVHDSDLLLRDFDGRRRYPGLHAVRDAIFNGERETRATVHLVDDEVDHGPILFRSEPFPVAPLVADALEWGAGDILRAYAYAHREWMIRAAWGPLLGRALESLALRPVTVVKGVAWIDGVPTVRADVPCIVPHPLITAFRRQERWT